MRDVARDLSLLTCLLTYLPAYLAQRLAHILAREVDGGGLLALLEEALAWVGARWVAGVGGKSVSRGRCDTGCTAPLEGC